MTDHDARVRQLQAELIATATARDEAAHAARLQGVRDKALSFADAATVAAGTARAGLDEAISSQAGSAARTAEAARTVSKAEAELERASHIGTAEEETAARERLDGLTRTLQSRRQADALSDERRRQADAAVIQAGQVQAEAERLLREAQQALEAPGRAPVSEATLQVIGFWYGCRPRPDGLPELAGDEQSHLRHSLHQAWLYAPVPLRPVTAADFQDPRLLGKAG